MQPGETRNPARGYTSLVLATLRFVSPLQESYLVAVTMDAAAHHEPRPESPASSSGAGAWLAAWFAALLVIRLALWTAGLPETTLEVAVEQGAAKAESWGVGETSDDVVRKAIRLQNETLPFWTTIALLHDFLADPLALIIRAFLVTVLFSSVAALTGRPVGFGSALRANSVWQGVWVLGALVAAVLMIVLRRPDVETGLTVLLPAGHYDATTWVALAKVDLFALVGWMAMAVGGWRRGQVNLFTALVVCTMLALFEFGLRIALSLMIGASMRLTLMPDFPT